jgi:hypothetical protein
MEHSKSVEIGGLSYVVEDLVSVRLPVKNVRFIYGAPTTGKTHLAALLRSSEVPVVDSDEFLNAFVPEWSSKRLWLRRSEPAVAAMEAEFRHAFAEFALKSMLNGDHKVAITNWLGADLSPYLGAQMKALIERGFTSVGALTDVLGNQCVMSAGEILPLGVFRSSATEVVELSRSRKVATDAASLSHGFPSHLVRTWAKGWNAISGRRHFVNTILLHPGKPESIGQGDDYSDISVQVFRNGNLFRATEYCSLDREMQPRRRVHHFWRTEGKVFLSDCLRFEYGDGGPLAKGVFKLADFEQKKSTPGR